MRKIIWGILFAVSAVQAAKADPRSCTTFGHDRFGRKYDFVSYDTANDRRRVLRACEDHPARLVGCERNLNCRGQYGDDYDDNFGGGYGNNNGYFQKTVIGGVIDRGYLDNRANFLELYGEFRGANNSWKNYRSEVECDGYRVHSWVDYESSRQINVAYNLPRDYARCYVRVIDNRGRASCRFGSIELTRRGGGRWDGLCR